jgi:exodeoxyribonuclease VII large subunit
VIVYPVSVQGAESAPQIVNMIKTVEKRNEVDVILLARGGGSLEDLWSFNEEIVARAIYACSLPIVVGVGHEIDFTIADMVADYRAATPTAAAELVSPNQFEFIQRLVQADKRLTNAIGRVLNHNHQQLNWLSKQLQHPGRRIQDLSQRLDELQLRLSQTQARHFRDCSMNITVLKEKLAKLHPRQAISMKKQRLHYLSHQLRQSALQTFSSQHSRFSQVTKTLNAVSPLATLERGYAIVTNVKDGNILRDAGQINRGDKVRAKLRHGNIKCTVEDVEYD